MFSSFVCYLTVNNGENNDVKAEGRCVFWNEPDNYLKIDDSQIYTFMIVVFSEYDKKRQLYSYHIAKIILILVNNLQLDL